MGFILILEKILPTLNVDGVLTGEFNTKGTIGATILTTLYGKDKAVEKYY